MDRTFHLFCLILSSSTFAQSGPVFHWRLDETSGNTAYATAGSSNGTLVGSVLWDANGGHHQGAARFDGVDDRIVLGSCDLTSGGQEISLSLWVKPDFVTGMERTLITKTSGPQAGDHVWSIAFINATALRFRLANGRHGNGTEHATFVALRWCVVPHRGHVRWIADAPLRERFAHGQHTENRIGGLRPTSTCLHCRDQHWRTSLQRMDRRCAHLRSCTTGCGDPGPALRNDHHHSSRNQRVITERIVAHAPPTGNAWRSWMRWDVRLRAIRAPQTPWTCLRFPQGSTWSASRATVRVPPRA